MAGTFNMTCQCSLIFVMVVLSFKVREPSQLYQSVHNDVQTAYIYLTKDHAARYQGQTAIWSLLGLGNAPPTSRYAWCHNLHKSQTRSRAMRVRSNMVTSWLVIVLMLWGDVEVRGGQFDNGGGGGTNLKKKNHQTQYTLNFNRDCIYYFVWPLGESFTV